MIVSFYGDGSISFVSNDIGSSDTVVMVLLMQSSAVEVIVAAACKPRY